MRVREIWLLGLIGFAVSAVPVSAEPITFFFEGEYCSWRRCESYITGYYTLESETPGQPPSGYAGAASGYAFEAITDFAISTRWGIVRGETGRVTTDVAPRLNRGMYYLELVGFDGWRVVVHQPFVGLSVELPVDAGHFASVDGTLNGLAYRIHPSTGAVQQYRWTTLETTRVDSTPTILPALKVPEPGGGALFSVALIGLVAASSVARTKRSLSTGADSAWRARRPDGYSG